MKSFNRIIVVALALLACIAPVGAKEIEDIWQGGDPFDGYPVIVQYALAVPMDKVTNEKAPIRIIVLIPNDYIEMRRRETSEPEAPRIVPMTFRYPGLPYRE